MPFDQSAFKKNLSKSLSGITTDAPTTYRSSIYLILDAVCISHLTKDKDSGLKNVVITELFLKLVTWSIRKQSRSTLTWSNNLSMYIDGVTTLSDCGKVITAFTGDEPKFYSMEYLRAIADSIVRAVKQDEVYCKALFDFSKPFGKKIVHFELMPDYVPPENRLFTKSDCEGDKNLIWKLLKFQENSYSRYKVLHDANFFLTWGRHRDDPIDETEEE